MVGRLAAGHGWDQGDRVTVLNLRVRADERFVDGETRDFKRDSTVQPRIVREVHDPHAALTELAEDTIAAEHFLESDRHLLSRGG